MRNKVKIINAKEEKVNFIINGIRGLCMALADSVPGVSGGTIAFILGFYDKFINSLDSLVFGKKEVIETIQIAVNDISKSHKLTYLEYKNRPKKDKIQEHLFRLCAPLM